MINFRLLFKAYFTTNIELLTYSFFLLNQYDLVGLYSDLLSYLPDFN